MMGWRRRLASFAAGVRAYGWTVWLLYCLARVTGWLAVSRRHLRRHVPLQQCARFSVAVGRDDPRVSVVVPTYNGVTDGLEELLRSLRAQKGCAVEIVGVDSSSTDGTR